jgi:hypothetical protein
LDCQCGPSSADAAVASGSAKQINETNQRVGDIQHPDFPNDGSLPKERIPIGYRAVKPAGPHKNFRLSERCRFVRQGASNVNWQNGKTGKITGRIMNLSSFALFSSSNRLTWADN